MKISLSNDRGTLDIEFPEFDVLAEDSVRDLKSRLLPFLNAKIECDKCQSTSMKFKGLMTIEHVNGLYHGEYRCLDCGRLKKLDGCFDPKDVIWGKPEA